MNPPNRDELIALTAQEHAKRQAYLRRRFSPEELWRWQQQSLAALAKLRPGARRGRQDGSKPSQADQP